MAIAPQLWIKRMELTNDASSVALPFPSDDPPELTRRFADAPQPVPGSIRRFRVDLDSATAVGDWRFRVFKDGVGTVLDLTIPQGSTTAGTTDDADVVSFDQFDLLRIDIDASTPGTTDKPWTFTMEFTPAVSGERAYGGGHLNFFGDAVDPGLVYKQNPFFPRTDTWGDDTLDEFKTENCPIGQDGTITNILIYYQIEMLSGEYEFVLWKCPAGSDPSDNGNYVRQDGSGATVDTRTTLDANSPMLTDSSASARSYCLGDFDLPVDEGDFVYITVERISGTTFPVDSVGLRGMVLLKFVADNKSRWFIAGAGLALGGAAPNYITPLGDRALVDSSPTTTGINVGRFSMGVRFTGLTVWVEDPPGDGTERRFEVFSGGVATDIVATMSGTDTTADDEGTALVGSGEPLYIKHTPTSVPSDNTRFWFTYFGTSEPAQGGGFIGPLAWVHWPRRIPTTSPATIKTDTYSDMDMQCPAEWENGFKEGLITEWGEARRPSSHLFTGEWQGTTFSFQIADKQGRFRAQQASLTDRYWNEPLTVRMTSRANRADLGVAFTVFCGPIIEAQPTSPLLWDVTLGDVVSQGLLTDQAQVPWRKVSDGFLEELDSVSENLDPDTPDPIIYGTHDRSVEEGSPTGETGFRIVPIYLGIGEVIGQPMHIWLVCGHAVQAIEVYVDDVRKDEATSGADGWLIPYQIPWIFFLGSEPYVDKVSDTYGTVRRYTLIYGAVGDDEPDACALGEQELTVEVSGIEDVGDGSGSLITDRFDQYKHFLINFVANQGQQSYQSGAWLANPIWDLFDGEVNKVDEDSFDDARSIANDRLTGGYLGAVAISIRTSVKTAIANFNRSCACRFNINHNGQMFIYLLHPTQEAKDAAVLYTDAYEILDGSFGTELAWQEHATSIPFQTDYDQKTGTWRTSGREADLELIENYGGKDIPSETREYPYAPGLEQARHIAILELRIRRHRPRYVRLDGTIGANPITGDSLAYREAGDYIRYECFDAVQETREIRMAQIIDPGVRVGPRRVSVIAMDVEDLIDYDLESSPSPGGSP